MKLNTTNTTLGSNLCLEFSEAIRQALGLHFPPHEWGNMMHTFQPAVSELGLENTQDAMRWVIDTELTPSHIEVIARHFTICETYFFREPLAFHGLKKHVLPGILEEKREGGRQQINVWSAGCSTGEEVYSIAMFLHSMLPEDESWDIQVLGTDINLDALSKAADGEYNSWSFRDMPPDFIETYFDRYDDSYRVKDHIRELVSFRQMNLIDYCENRLPIAPKDCDLIFCRNVLIYFEREEAVRIVNKMSDSLKEHGWLITSLTENGDRG